MLERVETRTVTEGEWEHPPTKRQVDVDFNVAVCGGDGRVAYNWFRVTESETRVDCPKCNQKLAKRKLKAREAGAPILTMEQDKEAKGGFRYRQGWRAIQDGHHIGYLGYEDHAWRVYRLSLDDDQKMIVGAPLQEDGSYGSRGYYSGLKAERFKSKEAALLGAGVFRAAGKLRTYQELLDDRAAGQVRAQAYAAKARQEHAEQEELRTDTLTALREILESETLTNFQRQGLLTAMEKFKTPKPEPFNYDEASADV